MIIKNNILSVEINSFGAEVRSIKNNKEEYVWQGNPKYWKRSSPVLFPIVGRLLDDEYYYKGKKYTLGQHGFARDTDFKLIENNDYECTFLLKENEQTLKIYPFKFNLFIQYKLNKNELSVKWIVENTNNENMYFQIGSHPAFNFLNGSHIEINKNTNKYDLNGTPYVHNVIPNVYINSIEVTDEIFLKDALIYDGIESITIKDNSKSVIINCPSFPYLGIWSKTTNNTNAPFVCLEPWHGITDSLDHNKQLKDKKGINILKPFTKFETSYSIIIK